MWASQLDWLGYTLPPSPLPNEFVALLSLRLIALWVSMSGPVHVATL